MDKKLTREELKEVKKKEFLEGIEKKGISNIIFKTEGLGALEFDLEMVGKNFEIGSIPFRIERVSTESFLKLQDIKDGMKAVETTLKTFVAYPVEARDKEYFNLDLEAMTNIVEFILDFQQTPILFLENFKGNAKN